MNTLKTIAASVALSLSLVLASSAAFAGEKGAGKMAFPVAAATYKQHVDARLEKKKTKLEERIASKKIPADKAEQMRAKFAERKAKVNAAVEKAVADGTVTKEEAKEVRKAGGGHGHKGKKGKPALARAEPASASHAVPGTS